MDIIGSIFNLLVSSLFSVQTYVGVVLGILFTPLWVSVWNFAKAKLTSKFPSASIVIKEVEIGVGVVKAELDPAVDAAKKALDDAAQK